MVQARHVIAQGFELIGIPEAAEIISKTKNTETLELWERLLINYAKQEHNDSLREFVNYWL